MKITQVQIENFRGITLKQSIPFEKDKKACSIVIFGDNGSGKSSIIDALELGLQGRIYRKSSESEFVPQVLSITKQFAEIRITLKEEKKERGEKKEKTEEAKEEEIVIQGNDITISRMPHTRFRQSPIVLRRHDITDFWATPAKDRLKHFYDYLPDEELGLTESTQTAVEFIKKEKEVTQIERNVLLADICQKINIPLDKIPLDQKPFELFRATFKKENASLYDAVKSSFDELTKISAKIRDFNKEIKKVRNPEMVKLYRKKLRDFFINSALRESFSNDFLRLSGSMSSILENVEIVSSEAAELDFWVKIKGNTNIKLPPQKFFSEANLDLLAILLYLNVAKEAAERGQAKILVLDDIFQSVDANIRGKVLDYMMQQFHDWQLIFTVHDNLWLQKLTNKLRLSIHSFLEYEIKNWNLIEGPKINISTSHRYEILKNYATQGTIQEICSYAGITLEYLLEEVSFIIKLKMSRKWDNFYYIKEYLEAFRDEKEENPLKKLVDKLHDTLPIRNQLGAHYHEWAQSLSQLEAKEFGNAVLTFYTSVFCKDGCNSWVAFHRIPVRKNYAITNEIIEKLKTEGIPDSIIKNLKNLKGFNDVNFKEELKNRLPNNREYDLQIFLSAKYEDSYKPSYKCVCGKICIE